VRARLSRTLVGFVVMLAWSASAPAQDKARAIDALLARYHEVGAFNGAALVAEGGTVILEKGYGFADFEWKIPNAPDTKFRLGSITKQFTATLVLQLVEDGTLSLETTLAEALPYYRRDTGGRVTIHHLLDHTSGIPSYTVRRVTQT
jgi:CubicO group peptidase (beta-lactamase class C family)